MNREHPENCHPEPSKTVSRANRLRRRRTPCSLAPPQSLARRSTNAFDDLSFGKRTPGRGRSDVEGHGVLRLRHVIRKAKDMSPLRCNENKKGVPPRVEYVLEAQALKEARDDPRRRRSSPEILLHDGAGSKRENRTERAGDEREGGVAAVFSAVSREGSAGGGGGVRVLAGVSGGGGAGSEAVGAGASAAGEGDCVGQVEERPGGFGNAGAFAALRFVAGRGRRTGRRRRGGSRCDCGRRWCGSGRG